MKDAKLIKVLRLLPAGELKRWRDLVYSPFFNKNKVLQQFCDYILKYAPDFEHPALERDTVFATLFPNEGARDNKSETINMLSGKLFALLERFIFMIQTENKAQLQEIELLRFYDTHHQSNYFQSALRNLSKIKNAHPYRNKHFFYEDFLEESLKTDYYSEKNDESKGDVNFQAAMYALDVFYLCSKLEQLCQMRNRQRSVQQPYTYTLMEEILSFLQNDTQYRRYPAINMWYSALCLLNEPTLERYDYLKQLLEQHAPLLEIRESKILYTYLVNTLRDVVSGQAYYEKVFELYQFGLTQNFLFPLLPTVLRNIVLVGLMLNKVEWVSNFLETAKPQIAEHPDKEDAFNLCLAWLDFKKGNFDAVLDRLNTVFFNSIIFKIDERCVRLKIYYELGLDELFLNLINSFRKFVTDNKNILPANYVQWQRDFINTTYDLFNTAAGETKKLQAIKEQIVQTAILPERTWLLEKLELKMQQPPKRKY
ncbi:MAG: hypothetical protein IPL35_17395 [Sphingobacteriales bacterium]|nr:hypothetical protein [Sphingobacteriales bacterium]